MIKRISWLGVTAVVAAVFAGCLLTLLFRQPAAGLSAGVRYVRPDGNDAGNTCLVPDTPCATIQRAVDVAAAGDEIWVAGGTYTGVQMRGSISQLVYISRSVTIQGGYTAVFDSPPDPQANPTILDAANQGRVIFVAPFQIVSLAGLQLMNGRAGQSNHTNYGGALYSVNADLLLDQIVMVNNQAALGGGLYVHGGRLSMRNSTLTNNQASQGGGGARIVNVWPQSGAGLLMNNTVSGNTAGLFGGGLYLSRSWVELTHNRFENNAASVEMLGRGGGLYLRDDDVSLHQNVIEGNVAMFGGGVWLEDTAVAMTSNTINSNQAETGGGIYVVGYSGTDEVSLDNNVLAYNSSVMISDHNPAPILRHNTIRGNDDGIDVYNGRLHLLNTIIADQPYGVINFNLETVTLTATLWDDVATPLQGNISQSGSLTGSAAFAADGVHLTAVSDAIDNGVDAGLTADLDGLPRPAGNGFDMGAVEWHALTALKTAQPDTAVPGALVTYTIVLTGPATPTVWLTDVLPADVTFVGPLTMTAGSGGHSGGVITWTGQIVTGTAVVLRWPVQVAGNVPPATSLPNTAVIRTPTQTLSSTTAVVVIPATIYLPLSLRGDTYP